MSRRLAAAGAADAASVLAFAALGRRSHDEAGGVASVLGTAAPFLCALVVAWIATAFVLRRRGEPPVALLRPNRGAVIAIATTASGMVARRALWERGTAVAFVVVTSMFLIALLAGWRTLYTSVLQRRRRAGSVAG